VSKLQSVKSLHSFINLSNIYSFNDIHLSIFHTTAHLNSAAAIESSRDEKPLLINHTFIQRHSFIILSYNGPREFLLPPCFFHQNDFAIQNLGAHQLPATENTTSRLTQWKMNSDESQVQDTYGGGGGVGGTEGTSKPTDNGLGVSAATIDTWGGGGGSSDADGTSDRARAATVATGGSTATQTSTTRSSSESSTSSRASSATAAAAAVAAAEAAAALEIEEFIPG